MENILTRFLGLPGDRKPVLFPYIRFSAYLPAGKRPEERPWALSAGFLRAGRRAGEDAWPWAGIIALLAISVGSALRGIIPIADLPSSPWAWRCC